MNSRSGLLETIAFKAGVRAYWKGAPVWMMPRLNSADWLRGFEYAEAHDRIANYFRNMSTPEEEAAARGRDLAA